MIKVIIAKTYEAAVATAASGEDWVAIETEYGFNTLDDSHQNVIQSYNHHGKLQHNDPPSIQCMDDKNVYDNFIVSHIDLDVLFGILWSTGWLKKTFVTQSLAELIAEADISGFHQIENILEKTPVNIKKKYFAIGYLVNSWFFNDSGLETKDISKEVNKLLLKIKDIIISGPTPEQVDDYTRWLFEQRKAAKRSLKYMYPLLDDKKLFIFKAGFSLTNAYKIEDFQADIIIQYNENSKSITLSCYDDNLTKIYFGEEGVIKPLVDFFGPEAGGKFSIGGSPRNLVIQPEIMDAFISYVNREYLNIPTINKNIFND